jgi:hypothetical protein
MTAYGEYRPHIENVLIQFSAGTELEKQGEHRNKYIEATERSPWIEHLQRLPQAVTLPPPRAHPYIPAQLSIHSIRGEVCFVVTITRYLLFDSDKSFWLIDVGQWKLEEDIRVEVNREGKPRALSSPPSMGFLSAASV